MKLSRGTFVVALLLAGCGRSDQPQVDHGWVRLAAAPGRPASAYFTLTGGARDERLMSVTSPLAVRSEMHETAHQGAMLAMTPVTLLVVPAHAEIAFAPGGKHVMLFDVNARVKPGGTVPLVLTFADSLKLQVDAQAIAAGDPPPK